MKAIFTILAATALTISSFAQQQFRTNKLTIGSTGNTPIRVMVDGSRYSSNNGQGITLKSLSMGYHTVKVFVKRNGRGNNNPGGNWGNNGGYQSIYTAQVLLKPNTHTDITVNRFGKVMVDEQQMGPGYYDEDDDEDWGENGNWNGNNGNWNNGQSSMNERVFEQFKQTLRNESFENTRVTLAKQTISANFLTALQVKDILNLFSFESSKLDLAKYAYDYTVDRGSYFLVNDVFSFSSSKDELNNYIRTKR